MSRGIVIEELLNRFIEHFGHKPQVYKAVEELLELAEVLIKDVNKEYSDKSHIVEEMADVCIMLHQVKMIYGITTEELKDIVKQKLKRTMIRISENVPKETTEDPQLSWSDYKDIDTLEINGDQTHRSRTL